MTSEESDLILPGNQSEPFVLRGTKHLPDLSDIHQLNKTRTNGTAIYGGQSENNNSLIQNTSNWNPLLTLINTPVGKQSQYETSPAQTNLKPSQPDPKPGYRDPKPGGNLLEAGPGEESDLSGETGVDAGVDDLYKNIKIIRRKKGKYKSRLLLIKSNTRCVS